MSGGQLLLGGRKKEERRSRKLSYFTLSLSAAANVCVHPFDLITIPELSDHETSH